MHVEFLFQRVTYSDPVMGDQLLSDDLVSEEFTFDRWPKYCSICVLEHNNSQLDTGRS